ncbi:MAG TPA: LysM peptidoglycan-binding domain-containing protein [bacterium]|nr:LysM peptidoglycan-binding domain-containing protein [bacterium]
MKTFQIFRTAARFLVIGALSASVAAAQDWDPASGRYLTEEEYQELSKDEALEYCEKLAQEIDIQNDNAAQANSMLGDIDAEISSLRERLARAKAETDPLAAEVAALEKELKDLQELPRSYTVVKGDFLIKISEMRRIYGNGSHWKRIYRANRKDISDPNLIYPDQVFLIPRGMPSSYTVREGESLAIIAGYVEVYGDRGQWRRLYDANSGAIGDDPAMLRPGTQLSIPR